MSVGEDCAWYNIIMRKYVLGLPVDLLSRDEVLAKIRDWIKSPGSVLR